MPAGLVLLTASTRSFFRDIDFVELKGGAFGGEVVSRGDNFLADFDRTLRRGESPMNADEVAGGKLHYLTIKNI